MPPSFPHSLFSVRLKLRKDEDSLLARNGKPFPPSFLKTSKESCAPLFFLHLFRLERLCEKGRKTFFSFSRLPVRGREQKRLVKKLTFSQYFFLLTFLFVVLVHSPHVGSEMKFPPLRWDRWKGVPPLFRLPIVIAPPLY